MFDRLKNLKLVQRFHGGVTLNPDANELPMVYRSNEQISEKNKNKVKRTSI